MSIGCFVADEVGCFVIEDVEVGDGICNLISPHPNPLPRGEGTLIRRLDKSFDRLRMNGYVVAVGIGEAVLDEVLGCFHAVADFDARGFAAHGVREEGGDVVAVFGDAVYVLLHLV